jgi:microcystin-dependent protein
MGFSGGGSSATRAHTHDSTIINDGGSLNLDNITQGGAAMTAGAITYSDGPAGHMQVLTLGAAGETLTVNGGATAPEWATGAASPINSGMVIPYAGTNATIPAGWLLCDGSSVATATYPDLHTAIGYAYGGAGANFNLPNMVGVFTKGAATQTATTGGANSKTLTVSEMPAHDHTINDPGHTHEIGGTYSGSTLNVSFSGRGVNSYSSTTGITINNTGGGSSFDNQPAFLEMQFIIKT